MSNSSFSPISADGREEFAAIRPSIGHGAALPAWEHSVVEEFFRNFCRRHNYQAGRRAHLVRRISIYKLATMVADEGQRQGYDMSGFQRELSCQQDMVVAGIVRSWRTGERGVRMLSRALATVSRKAGRTLADDTQQRSG
jgi:hypothetical protein